MTLSRHLNERTLVFTEYLEGWRDAVERVSAPLLASGAIERRYVDAMNESIADGGTYIDLGYGIALAHARPESGVVSTGMSALWVRPAVLLNDDPGHAITLFFCLAAADNASHLNAMASLARILTDNDQREALLAAQNPAEVLAVLSKGDV